MTDALRQAAENAADVLDEARTYVGCESWSPSMLEECERALRMLRAALAQPPAPTVQQCHCNDRPADQCPGEWEPGCDLGANPAHVRVAQPVQQPGDNINCKSVQKRLAVQAAPAQRQPLSDEQIDSLTFPFLTAELGPTAYDRAIARAIEAAHGITAAPAAQKGEKL